jgi:hypothetical protein
LLGARPADAATEQDVRQIPPRDLRTQPRTQPALEAGGGQLVGVEQRQRRQPVPQRDGVVFGDAVLAFVARLLGEKLGQEAQDFRTPQAGPGIDLQPLPVEHELGSAIGLFAEEEDAAGEDAVNFLDVRRQFRKVVQKLVAEDERERVAAQGQPDRVAAEEERQLRLAEQAGKKYPAAWSWWKEISAAIPSACRSLISTNDRWPRSAPSSTNGASRTPGLAAP